jgi:hypothetical protein
MHSIEPPAKVGGAFDALDAAETAVAELDFDTLTLAVPLRPLERPATSRRRQVAVSHDVIAGLDKEDPADVGAPVHKVVADWLRISSAEACRRLRDAKQLSPRLTPSGQELPPELPATAQPWRDGMLDGQRLRVIQTLFRNLREATPVDAVEKVERFLARQVSLCACGIGHSRDCEILLFAAHPGCSVMVSSDGRWGPGSTRRVCQGRRGPGLAIATPMP